MKVFIFEDVYELTDNYHCSGGLVVIAKDKNHVIELLSQYKDINIDKEEWDDVIVYDLKENVDPKVFIFPDAGCC